MKKLILFIVICAALATYSYSQEYLGFTVSQYSSGQGVLIDSVFIGSLAQNIDIKSGDVLLNANKTKFGTYSEAKKFFNLYKNSEKFLITIKRGNKQLEKMILVPKNNHVYLGLLLKKRQNKVFIQDVIPNSPAFNANLQRGNIILKIDGVRINSPEDVALIINKKGYGKYVNIELLDNGKTLYKKVLLYRWNINNNKNDSDNSEFIKDMKQIIYILERKNSAN